MQIYVTNSSFIIVGHGQLVNMVRPPRPGYTSPNRSDVTDKHLDVTP